jgi:uncharacterized protein YbaA (DUF1428 family)
MHIRVSDVTEAKNAWWAVRDRRMRNAINKTLFSDAERTRALGMAGVLDSVYMNKGVHVNYNKNSISIKVDGARVRDNKMLAQAEAVWQNTGVTKLVTQQGISYTLAKA